MRQHRAWSIEPALAGGSRDRRAVILAASLAHLAHLQRRHERAEQPQALKSLEPLCGQHFGQLREDWPQTRGWGIATISRNARATSVG